VGSALLSRLVTEDRADGSNEQAATRATHRRDRTGSLPSPVPAPIPSFPSHGTITAWKPVRSTPDAPMVPS